MGMERNEIIKYLADNLDIKEETIEAFIRQTLDYINDPINFSKLLFTFLNSFEKDSNKADKYFSNQRKDFIQNKIANTYFYYNYNFSEKAIVNDLLKSLRPQLEDQIKYWENELLCLPDSNLKFKKIDAEFKIEEVKDILQNLIESKNIPKQYKPNSESDYNSLRKLKPLPHFLFFNEITKLKNIVIIIDNIYPFISSLQKENLFKYIFKTCTALKEKLGFIDDLTFIDEIIHQIETKLNPTSDNLTNINYNVPLACHDDCNKKTNYVIEYDSQKFNKAAHRLLNYLIENYVYKDLEIGDNNKRVISIKFSNLWYFLNKNNLKKSKYILYLKRNEYVELINEKCDFDLKSFNNNSDKFHDEMT
jgi:hypothetical protein